MFSSLQTLLRISVNSFIACVIGVGWNTVKFGFKPAVTDSAKAVNTSITFVSLYYFSSLFYPFFLSLFFP